MWDLSSLSRDRTRAPYKRTVETQPLNHQGSFRFYIFIKSNLPAFSSVACSFGVISKKSSPNPMSWSFSPKFYPKSFIVLALILILLWVNFYIWSTVRIQLHFFFFLHARYVVLSSLFDRKTEAQMGQVKFAKARQLVNDGAKIQTEAHWVLPGTEASYFLISILVVLSLFLWLMTCQIFDIKWFGQESNPVTTLQLWENSNLFMILFLMAWYSVTHDHQRYLGEIVSFTQTLKS